MTIIAFASGKGGVSKTTLAASTASYLARQGKNVGCIDADPNAHLMRWIGRMGIEGLSCREVDENTVARAARELAAKHEFVVIDAAGVLSLGLAKIATVADVVVIPSKAGDGDTVEAARTYRAMDDLGQAHKAVAIMTQSDPRTGVAQHARQQIMSDGVPLLDAVMPPRVAYQEAWIRGVSPVDMGNDALTNDVASIVSAILGRA